MLKVLVRVTVTIADSFGNLVLGLTVTVAVGLAFSSTLIALLEIIPQVLEAVTLYVPAVAVE